MRRRSTFRYGDLLSRRELLRLGMGAGASLAALSLLAACGDSAEPGSDNQGGSSGGGGGSSAGGGAATPAATSASGSGEAPTPAPVGTGEKGRVLVRTPGGAEEEAWRTAAWEPFAAETGIQVVPVAANAARIVAMVQAGSVDIDVLNLGENLIIDLIDRGAIEPLDQARFERTDLADVNPVYEYYTGNYVYSTVLGYNTEAFPDGHPTSWVEFWDVEGFPGARMLQDLAADIPNLEQALLADGVAMDQIYPIDIDRAFNSLNRIKDHITKYWDSGAVSAQMLADKQVVLGSVWNGRIQALIDRGAPLAIEWNQAQRILQVFAVPNGAPNRDHAYQLIDYMLSPEVQAKFAEIIGYGPVNQKAFDHIDPDTAAKLPTSPEHMEISFANDAQWWFENRDEVSERWQEFLLS